MKKYYEILGLKEGASKKEIKIAFEKLSKELDPKKNHNQDFFIEEYKKVNDAYDRLMNSSILSEKKVIEKLSKTEDDNPKSNNNLKPNSDKKDPLKKIRIKQNIFMIIIIALLGFNAYLFQQIKGDNNSASLAKEYANDAEDYSSDARSYMYQAEDYSSDAQGYMSQAEDYSNYAEDYSSQAQRHANDAYYYSNN